MHNPYSNVDTTTCPQVMTTTHDHLTDNNASVSVVDTFDNLYNGGIRCLAVSNYYPSKPMYPIADYAQEIGREPPSDIVEIPNAEHHHFSVKGYFGNSLHMNAVGSTFESGSPKGVSPVGYNGEAERFVKEALSDLVYADGGGITLNHPGWTQRQSSFPDENFIYMLDQDERVLGIEIFSSDYTDHANDLALWDKILNTGRKCFGFAVPDHRAKPPTGANRGANWLGRIMLYVPNFTAHDCLKAIRNGEFYAKIRNTDFRFTKIAVEDSKLKVSTNQEATIRFIVDGVTANEFSGVTEAECTFANAYNFIRAEAEIDNDALFTQPIMMWVRPRGVVSQTMNTELYRAI